MSIYTPPSPSLLRFLCWQVDRIPTSTLRQSTLCAYHTRQIRKASTNSRPELKLLAPPRSHPVGSIPSAWPTIPEPVFRDNTIPTSLLQETNPITRRRRSSAGDKQRPLLRRLFSSQQHLSWWPKWWIGAQTPRRGQLPPLASFLDASSSGGRSMKAANEPRLRCTEFNENGNVTLVNGEFKKSELITKV